MFSQAIEKRQQQGLDAVQPARKAALTQHIWHVPFSLQQRPRGAEIPAQKQCSHHSHRHNFRVGHPALWILIMAQGFEHIIHQAKNGYNFRVHEFSSLVWVSAPQTLAGNSWISSLGSNLG
jgi:hypothetical protein